MCESLGSWANRRIAHDFLIFREPFCSCCILSHKKFNDCWIALELFPTATTTIYEGFIYHGLESILEYREFLYIKRLQFLFGA